MTDAPKATKPKSRGVKFPVKMTVNERKFVIHGVDTRDLWRMYAEYENMMVSLVPTNDGDAPKLTRNDAVAMVDMMVELCELCHEEGRDKVLFDHYFEPGEDTPSLLMQKVAETLFGPFMSAKGPSGFQPLIQRVATPFMNAIGGQ